MPSVKTYLRLWYICGFNKEYGLNLRHRYLNSPTNERCTYNITGLKINRPYSKFLEDLAYCRWNTKQRRNGTALYYRWNTY